MKHMIILLLLLKGLNLFGQSGYDRGIRIRVLDEKNQPMDSLALIYTQKYSQYNSAIRPNEIYANSGYFSFAIPGSEELAYFTVISKQASVKNPWLLYNAIGEPGDNVIMKIDKEAIAFSGRGCEKFNLLQQIANSDRQWLKFINDSVSRENNIKEVRYTGVLDSIYVQSRPESFLYALVYSASKLNYQLKILETYRTKISPVVFQVIKNNLLGEAGTRMINQYSKFYKEAGISKLDTSSVARVQDSLHGIYASNVKKLTPSFDAKYLLLSKGYSEFMIFCARNAKTIRSEGIDWIMGNSTGELKEKLLVQFFIYNFKGISNLDDTFSQIMKVIKMPVYREALSNFYDKVRPGVPAFDFSLRNVNGRVVKSTDFKGKMLVLDFWFTGCIGCKQLAPHMKLIADSLKSRTDIVFVSVSIDKDEKLWKESVRSHAYSNERSIDLFTNGSGSDHPIIKHYKISSYPSLVIIDKNGVVKSTNPIRPNNKETRDKFISLLF